MNNRNFGEIQKYPTGSVFNTRKELSEAGVHRPPQAGISGSEEEGADSVVLSGGYDDIDNGDEIIYTGHGGQDENTGKQISDQSLTHQNKALALSSDRGLFVRVIRGSGLNSNFAPKSGYRYDGLYLVDNYWTEHSGVFLLYKFRLIKVPETTLPPLKEWLIKGDYTQPAKRVQTTTLRIVRDTKKAIEVKKLYDYHCQVCNVRLAGANGPYAEGAHIKPLGEPHDGPDEPGNILCLCPNHHILFDLRVFSVADNFVLIGLPGKLTVKSEHQLNLACLQYRREHY